MIPFYIKLKIFCQVNMAFIIIMTKHSYDHRLLRNSFATHENASWGISEEIIAISTHEHFCFTASFIKEVEQNCSFSFLWAVNRFPNKDMEIYY